MTYKERLNIVKQDIKGKFPSVENIKENTLANLHDVKKASDLFKGIAIGAVKYAPFLFCAKTSTRKIQEKEEPVFKSRAKELYDYGTISGGVLSNLAIHGGTLGYFYTKDKAISILLYAGTLIGTNILSNGYEYWRETGKRLEQQKEKEGNLEKSINEKE